MDSYAGSFDVFSPRWGHPDRYTVSMSGNEMIVSNGNFSATCKAAADGGNAWTGYNASTGNPLMNMFANDMIHAPAIVAYAIELAWKKWRASAVTDAEFREGMVELFAWIDATSRGKPRSALWQGAF